MSVVDRVWTAFTTVLKMDDKVTALAATDKVHQAKIENLTERVIRLETALEIAMAASGMALGATPKQLR